MNFFTINRHHQFVTAFYIALAFLFAAQSSALAQTAQRKYKPGDKLEMNGGITYEIVECRIKPNTGEEECDFIALFENGTRSNLNTSLVSILRRDEQLAEAEKKRLAAISGRTAAANRTKPAAETPPEKVKEPETSEGEPELTVTAQQLYNEYNNNDTAAKRKYVVKTVRVTGAVIYTISETKFSARFNKTYSGSTIQCIVEDIEQIPTLNTGNTVTLVGKPLGSMTST